MFALFIKFFYPNTIMYFYIWILLIIKKDKNYIKNFTDKDHKEIAEYVKQLTCDWIITYDNAIEVI